MLLFFSILTANFFIKGNQVALLKIYFPLVNITWFLISGISFRLKFGYSFKYIQKFWLINERIENIFKKKEIDSNLEIDKFVNQSISKINFALENFRYNVIIAVFHEIYSYFKKII